MMRLGAAIAVMLGGCTGSIGGTDSQANTLGDDATMSAGPSGTDGTGGDEQGQLTVPSSGDMGSDDGSSMATTDPQPGDEVCNGIDDDGDGDIDEGLGDLSCGQGACATTVVACVAGVPGMCQPGAPGQETCNNVDDNCDGQTDEGLTQGCSTACGDGTEACMAGVFAGCDAPQPATETCDATDQNCDGSIDEGVASCRLGVHRSVHSSTGEHFYTTSLAEAQSAGFNLEAQDFYDIYIATHPGLTGWQRCLKANGKHFYTMSANCEGQTVEGTMGYVASTQIGDSRPLYRSFRGQNGDHFYTTSLAEHNNAIASSGYADEGVACYVW